MASKQVFEWNKAQDYISDLFC